MKSTTPEWLALANHLSEAIPDGNRRECTRQTGIPSATLTRKLMGTSPFRVDELERIAQYLGTTSSALMEQARDGKVKAS